MTYSPEQLGTSTCTRNRLVIIKCRMANFLFFNISAYGEWLLTAPSSMEGKSIMPSKYLWVYAPMDNAWAIVEPRP